MNAASGIEVRPAEGPARCPYCHDALAPEAARWTCPACEATHHPECLKEAGQRCAACRAPAKEPIAARTTGDLGGSSAMGAGFRAQAIGLVMAGLVGAVGGGQNGLMAAAAACVLGAIVTVTRVRGHSDWAWGLLHVVLATPVFGLIVALIDALDVPRRRPSATMLGICLLTAALSAAVARGSRRSS